MPNLISMLRLPIAAAFFVVDGVVWRGLLLSVGALTDAVDGWVARHFKLESKWGAVVDPLFDKLFVVAVLGSFLLGPYLNWAEYAILVARDVYVGAAFTLGRLLNQPVPASARLTGKVVTFLQMVTMFVLLLSPELLLYFVVIVGATGALAMVDYTLVAVRSVKRSPRAA